MLFSFGIALLKFSFLIFNPAKSFCTYILPLTVYVDVEDEDEESSFFAHEYILRDTKNTVITR